MATKKKQARKAPAKKVAAVHRLREAMAKKKPEKAHVLEDVPPTQPEFDFAALGDAKLKQANPVPEPGPEPGPVRSNLASTMEGYYDQYGPERNCGDMIAHILSFRVLEDLEVFVYEKTGKAYPGLNPGHRRMNCGNVIRGLVNRADTDTLCWLVSTSIR